MSANSHLIARRISSVLSSPSLRYFRDASSFVPPANDGFHPPPHRFPPNYCMSPFHPTAPSLALGPFITLSLHQSLSVSLRLSLVTLRLLPVFVCCINILWAPWWRVFTAGQTAPAEPPPVSPHACSSVNPLGSPSLSTLSPSLTLSLFLSLSSPALTKYNEPSSFLCCVKEILCFCVRQGCYS